MKAERLNVPDKEKGISWIFYVVFAVGVSIVGFAGYVGYDQYQQSIARTQQTNSEPAPRVSTARRNLTPAERLQKLEQCLSNKEASDVQISSCTSVIQSGAATNEILAVAFYNRGLTYNGMAQYDGAIQDFDQAIKLNPNYAEAFNNRGNAYASKGQLDRAIQDFDQAIKLNPDNAEAFNNRGLAYNDMGQLDRAIQDFDQAIKLDPSDKGGGFYNRGLAYKDKGQYDRANQDFDQAIKFSYKDKGQYDRAIQDFDQAKEAPQTQQLLWNHNGSTVYLVAQGRSRKFFYKEPLSGLLSAGAKPGSLIFDGEAIGEQYQGTAYRFSGRCGQLPYRVSGPILDNYRRVELRGKAPRVDNNCHTTGYVDDLLQFQLIEPAIQVGKNNENAQAQPTDAELLLQFCEPKDIHGMEYGTECSNAKGLPPDPGVYQDGMVCDVVLEKERKERFVGKYISSLTTTLVVPFGSNCLGRAFGGGGSALFEKIDSKYIFRGFDVGYLEECVSVPAPHGKDRLVCIELAAEPNLLEMLFPTNPRGKFNVSDKFLIQSSGRNRDDCPDTLDLKNKNLSALGVAGLSKLEVGSAPGTVSVWSRYYDPRPSAAACASSAKVIIDLNTGLIRLAGQTEYRKSQ